MIIFLMQILVGCSETDQDIRNWLEPQFAVDPHFRNYRIVILQRGDVFLSEENQGIEEIWCVKDESEICLDIDNNNECTTTWEPMTEWRLIAKTGNAIYQYDKKPILAAHEVDLGWLEWEKRSCPHQ